MVTIREYLHERVWLLPYITGGCALLAWYLTSTMHGTVFSPAPGDVGIDLAVLAVVAVALVAQLGMTSRLKCPKCNGSLRNIGLLFAYGRGPAHCPHCAVNFDAPMPQDPTNPVS